MSRQKFMEWLGAPEGPARIIATQISENEPLQEGQMKLLKTLCFAAGMKVTSVTLNFDVYTNSMGGGSQTFSIIHDDEDVKTKVRSLLRGLPESNLPIPRRFNTHMFLNTSFPHMLARGKIQYEDGPRNGNGGIVISAEYIIDIEALQ